MSYFNADQEAYMESLARIPLDQRCWCGWDRAGKCTSPNCKPDLTAADKCLPCYGIGKRWILTGAERTWKECPNCGGTGRHDNREMSKQ